MANKAEPATRSSVDRVFAYLRDLLMDGSIRPGDRLASERELAAAVGVSRQIVREALRAMAMIGAVEIHQRIGAIVRRPDVSVLGEFFAFALARQPDMIDDIMEARIAIECQAARLACERATVANFEAMRAALDRIEATIADPVEGARADFEFHAALVRAGKSDTLITLYLAMAELLLRSHMTRRAQIIAVPTVKEYLVDYHRRIFDVLAARDADRADQILRQHFAIGKEYRQQALLQHSPRRKHAAPRTLTK